MSQLHSLARIIGVEIPMASWLVQLHAENTTKQIQERLEKLEDPIGRLHDDVPSITKLLYFKLQKTDSNIVVLEKPLLERYSRALATLESQGHIRGRHDSAGRFSKGIRICDAVYLVYACSLSEDGTRLDSLIKTVDECRHQQSLRSLEVSKKMDLPNSIAVAVFDLYESKGFGYQSREVNIDKVYYGKA